ncbi:hypothetical protein [Burkholderia ubonensis]|uniref:hypothetical protein n=1 Tax=Burkholderia ubonensis TaxID=101571 RepID=UPI000751F93F|nr:hypothetical protein [Burkholderia ubonensis]KVP16971.1 hypothetical protein WJ84_01480 [Burkholderia ubonensis]
MEQVKKNCSPREELAGWQLHPKAAGVLLVVLLVSLGGVVWLPKEWKALLDLAQYLCAFSSGMLVAWRVAIWQRTDG